MGKISAGIQNASLETGLEKTPSQTQRSFANILEMIGTPAKSSVPRGNPKGRESGVKLEKKDTQPIHFKSAHQQNDLKKTISSPIENNQEKPNLNEIELILHRLKSEIKTLGLSHSEFIDLLISSA